MDTDLFQKVPWRGDAHLHKMEGETFLYYAGEGGVALWLQQYCKNIIINYTEHLHCTVRINVGLYCATSSLAMTAASLSTSTATMGIGLIGQLCSAVTI